RLGDECRGKCGDAPRNRECCARMPARHELDDPVDERVGREFGIRHDANTRSDRGSDTIYWRPPCQSGPARGNKWYLTPRAYAFCARTTSLQNVVGVNSRGMSATFIGVRKRSAGTSDRYSFSCASPF